MRYPIGKGTQEDFDKYWYIASYFGENRGSYYHSGDDYNLRTGGDSDLGQPLYAITDGEIVSTDTTSTTGFGKQIFLKFTIEGKTYYAGYMHCNSIGVKQGDRVLEGTQIGTLGKSGATAAHLHFVIKNTANGMDNVPNSLEELKQWENPTAFIKKYLGENMSDEKIYTEAEMTEVREERDENWNFYQEEKKAHSETSRQLIELQGKYNRLADEHDKCQELGKPVLISPSVEVADATWDINGVQVDSNGLVTANYARKK